MSDKTSWYRVTERNSWEGETWRHYFEPEPGVKAALEQHFDVVKLVHLSADQVELLANVEPGYMEPYWFGKLTDLEALRNATEDDLYKGGIRKYAKEALSVREVACEPSEGEA